MFHLLFLAQRATKRCWLGRPRINTYRKSVTTVRVISFVRAVIGIVFLTVILPENPQVIEGVRRRLNVLGALSTIFAVADWILYRVSTWKRQPTILMKWATPASAAASILANIALMLVARVTRGDSLELMAMLALVLAICGAVVMNAGLLYFVYYGPIKLPPLYQPVRKDAVRDQGDDDSASADTSRGPLARLYQAQLSSNPDTEDGRADNPQPASMLISVSSIVERKRARRAKYLLTESGRLVNQPTQQVSAPLSSSGMNE